MAWTQAVVRNRGAHEIMLVLNGMFPETVGDIKKAFEGLLPCGHIFVWHAPPPVNANDPCNAGRCSIAEAIREDFIKSIKPDLLHITSFFEGFDDNAVHSIKKNFPEILTSATFYDAIPLIQRDLYLDPHINFKKYYLEKIEHIQKADLLLSISASSRQEAVDHLKLPNEKVVNISSATDEMFQPRSYAPSQTETLKSKFGIRGKFIMYSGATDERKNHRGLIDAYAELPLRVRKQYQLVLAGGLPDLHRQHFQSNIKKRRLSTNDVIITGRVSDDDLVHLYNLCDLYVFPSWHEGFGLPALEAMSCGAPTIGSNTTSVPEVIGLERALFDPHSVKSISDKIFEVLDSETFKAELKAHSPVQARKFSWDETARCSLRAMEQLHAVSQKNRTPALKVNHATTFSLIDEIARIFVDDKAQVDLLALSQALESNIRKPKLLVDVSELMQRDSRSGIQRVVRSILREWLTQDCEHFDIYAVYATASEQGYHYASMFRNSFLNEDTPEGLGFAINGLPPLEDLPVNFASGDIFIGLDMQHWVQTYQAPYYQKLRDQGVGTYFVLYDLLPIHAPQFFSDAVSAAHTPWVQTLAQADGVICISQAVASEFDCWLSANPATIARKPKIYWFHLGADIQNSVPNRGLPVDANATLERFNSTPTFLIVSTLEPRKGHEQVLNAVEQLWREGIDVNLTLVGKPGWKVESLIERLQTHPECNKHLFWPQDVSDEYLGKIYEASTCLIAASYGEGFGLPLIEAAQHKLPILARDIPVFREVAGEHACYFRANESDELAQAMREWLALFRAGKHPQSKSMPWLTWNESAAQLRGILQTAAGTINNTTPEAALGREAAH